MSLPKELYWYRVKKDRQRHQFCRIFSVDAVCGFAYRKRKGVASKHLF